MNNIYIFAQFLCISVEKFLIYFFIKLVTCKAKKMNERNNRYLCKYIHIVYMYTQIQRFDGVTLIVWPQGE